MSRTYRYRHLPTRAAGYTFKHIIDGRGRNHWRHVDEAFEALYGPPPTEYQALIKHGTHREWVIKPVPSWWKTRLMTLKDGRWYYTKRPEWGSMWDHKELVDVPGAWRPTQEYFEYNRAKDRFAEEFVRPVMTWHPYPRRCRCCNRPWERKEEIRSNRRKNNVLAKHAEEDTIFFD